MKEFIETQLTGFKAQIAELTALLNAPVLDGTPFLLICEYKAPGYPALEMVAKGKEWRSLEIQDNHLSGCTLKSEESVQRAIKMLRFENTNLRLSGFTSIHVNHYRQIRLNRLHDHVIHLERSLELIASK
jgi:hypothetical protein